MKANRRYAPRAALRLGALLLLCALGAPAEQLWVRLAEASDETTQVAPELRDVASLLRDYLPYRAFDLLDSRRLELPASKSMRLAGGYLLRCRGSARELSVLLERDERVLVQTVLALREGRPFVLGGFPGPRGRVFLVLQVR